MRNNRQYDGEIQVYQRAIAMPKCCSGQRWHYKLLTFATANEDCLSLTITAYGCLFC